MAKKICVILDSFHTDFLTGRLEDYPDPSKVNCFGIVRNDGNGVYLWDGKVGSARGVLEGVVSELMFVINRNEGVVFADRRARDFMIKRHKDYFRPY